MTSTLIKKDALIFASLILITLSFSCCTKDLETVCEHLSEHGVADTSLLVGSWKLESFARTRTGKRIRRENKVDFDVFLEINPIIDNNHALSGETRVVNTHEIIFAVPYRNSNIFTVDNIASSGIYSINKKGDFERKYIQFIENIYCYTITDDGNELLFHIENTDDYNDNIIKFIR